MMAPKRKIETRTPNKDGRNMPVPPDWAKDWADFLAKLGQFAFGMVSVSLAVYAIFLKRGEIFRSELHKRQFEEVGSVRNDLVKIALEIIEIPRIKNTMEFANWNFDKLKEHEPESWETYERYKRNSIELFHKFRVPSYYLWPKWIDTARITEFAEAMLPFAPFTLVATAKHSDEEIGDYTTKIFALLEYLDGQLSCHG